jgi:hypothetical protein
MLLFKVFFIELYGSSVEIVSPEINMPSTASKTVAFVLDPLLVLRGVSIREVRQVLVPG